MRKFIQIMKEDADLADRVNSCLGAIAEYIMHNQPQDWAVVHRALLDLGYQEPTQQNDFYRALFHDVTDADRIGKKRKAQTSSAPATSHCG